MAASKRICLVSQDFLGPIRNGGIGTAMTALAETLAADGHLVTLLYPSAYTETLPLTCWMLDYRKRGILFEPLFASEMDPEQSYLVYRWLKDREFDIVHFHDLKGIGYWSFVAKRQGLAFAGATLVCQAHAQTFWHTQNSGEFLSDLQQLRFDYMEQRSVELADVLYSPSHYMLDWMRDRAWKLPANTLVWPNLLPSVDATRLDYARLSGVPQEVREVVFFGRLETRKGVELFCSAVSRALASGLEVERITFLGKEGLCGDEPATAHIARATKGWAVPFVIINDLDTRQARAYLAQDGRVAVIASASENSPYTVLECLVDRIPLLAPDVGGIGELIDPADRESVLYPREAGALAHALLRIAAAGVVIARPSREVGEAKSKWLTWHRRQTASVSSPAEVPRPLVSVCISHFSRPRLLRQAIESVEGQTYPAIEVVLVDDASPDRDSHDYLNELEPRFSARGWRIIRNSHEMWTGAARNCAARHSTGEFVLFMDDDNIAKPLEVETFVKAALHSGADVLTCQMQPFRGVLPPPSGDAELPIGWIPIGAAISLALFENCLGDANMMVRRSIWEALGGFTEDRYGCEDYEFLSKAVLRGVKLECLPEILFYYRFTETNLSRRTDSVALYNSFSRAVRPFIEHVRPDLAMALLFASNSAVNSIRQRKQGFWAPFGADAIGPRISELPLNTGAALVEIAKVAMRRGQTSTARLMYEQALRNSLGNTDPALGKAIDEFLVAPQ
jgi:glycosyltransferase involved in cell wall biosynthesis